MATLTITNLTGQDVTLDSDDNEQSATVAANDEADLGEELLLSDSFHRAYLDGEVGFDVPDQPAPLDDEKAALGQKVLGRILTKRGSELVGLKGQVAWTLKELERRRDQYNAHRQRTEESMVEGKGAAESARALHDAANYFLNLPAYAKRVSDLQGQIDNIDPDEDGDDQVSPEELDTYYAERSQLERELQAAKVEQERAQKRVARQYGQLLDQLDTAAEYFAAIDETEIGEALDWEASFDDAFEDADGG